jgi:periplasmic divalent cation tolerance protein
MNPKDEAVLVLTTTASDEAARILSRLLIEERLAACVTRTVVRSVYRWKPADAETAEMQVQEDDEVLLLIKTAASCADALEARIAELHPYEVPEIVRIAVDHVDDKYLAWLIAACH